MLDRLKRWAKALKRELVLLWLCAKHPRTPLAAKILAVVVIAYAVSPIDLIPDFIPVLGYLDDLLLLPIGIWIVWKLVPADIVDECRVEAANRSRIEAPGSWKITATVAIIALWLLLAWIAWRWWAA